MNKSRLQLGFTLIETLVAIAILMVAIAGPLNIAEKALVTATSSRDETIASYLAQDLMEYVKNDRDNNLLNGRTWLNGISQCTSAAPCVTETSGTANPPALITSVPNCTFSATPPNLDASCRLYIDSTNKYYTYQSGGSNQPTQFYRTFTLTPIGIGADSGNIDLLTVSVYWANGTILNNVTLQSVIFNTER